MRKILFAIIAAAVVVPAWAARGGGGSGHGSSVSAAAHSAHQAGSPPGASVRTTARANSQGPSHASANAISHVQNSPGKANANSVLGDGGTVSTTNSARMSASSAKAGKAKGKNKNKNKSKATSFDPIY